MNQQSTSQQPEKRSYELSYRQGNKTPSKKFFEFEGDLKAATERARRHCEIMGLVYIYTAPFIVNLDAQEKTRFLKEFAEAEDR